MGEQEEAKQTIGKDLKKLANKYQSLSDTEKMDLEVQAHGQVVSEWAMNRSEEMNKLIEYNWFHFDKLGVEVAKDSRLRLMKELLQRFRRENRKKT